MSYQACCQLLATKHIITICQHKIILILMYVRKYRKLLVFKKL